MAPRTQPELLTTDEVAELLSYRGPHRRRAAARQLQRWGIEPYDRKPGRDGGNRYPAEKVRDEIRKREASKEGP